MQRKPCFCRQTLKYMHDKEGNKPKDGDFFALRGDIASLLVLGSDSLGVFLYESSLRDLPAILSFLNFLRHDFERLNSPSPRSLCVVVLYS